MWLVETPSARVEEGVRAGSGQGGGWNGKGEGASVVGQRVPASTREQLFNCIQRREGRKGSLVVYEVPGDTRAPRPPPPRPPRRRAV